jgi:hypothetical protein
MKASKFIKRLHRQALQGNLNISLKQFARETLQVAQDDDQKEAAKTWFVNKGPSQRRADKADRKKRKGATNAAIAAASKAARRKGKK